MDWKEERHCANVGVDGAFAVHTLDEANAFTHIQTPESWWPMMGGPAVYAKELPSSWVDPTWHPNLLIGPQYTRLGMGFSHAVFILQNINLEAAVRAVRSSALLTGRHLRVVFLNKAIERETRVELTGGTKRNVAIYIHLDDIAALAAQDSDARLVVDVIDTELRNLGFLTTRADATADGSPYVGFVPQRSPIRWHPAPLRLGNLDRALEEILAYHGCPWTLCIR